jgi:hypothetical protein
VASLTHRQNISKTVFGGLFLVAWSKGASIADAVQVFECSGIVPFNRDIIHDETSFPSDIFYSLTHTNASRVHQRKENVMLRNQHILLHCRHAGRPTAEFQTKKDR